MTTREQESEACIHYSKGVFESLNSAAARLKRDGKLIEKLKALEVRWRKDHKSFVNDDNHLIISDALECADELSALLKEAT